MTEQLVGLRREGAVAELVLDRASALNAISTAFARRLAETAARLGADSTISAVVVSSSSERAFCVGADLKERASFSDAELMEQRPLFRAAFAAVRRLPMPVAAAVEGFALGGGYELALSCDVIVAGDSAVVGLPEVGVGLVPGCGGTQLVARRAGMAVAADVLFTGRRVGATEAAALGLLDRVVAAGSARTTALQWAGAVAAGSPVALRQAKWALRAGAAPDLDAGLDAEDSAWRVAASSPDRREGIAAFAQKRAPVWPSAGTTPATPGKEQP